MIRVVFSCCDYFPFFHRIHGFVFRPDGALTSYPRERTSYLACTGSVSSQQRGGASGTGRIAMTCASYLIIHHPLSQQNAGPAEGLPVLFPQWRGSCYRAEQCSTSFSRCRVAAPDAPAGPPPSGGGIAPPSTADAAGAYGSPPIFLSADGVLCDSLFVVQELRDGHLPKRSL